ncbi:CAP domain-containing protein [Massilia sp. IC2-477]|uniref:CAP domain-containing protein n=1 Tax=Massilia sp. IC2-477 TaxID=2887198 RepID=UPI001D0FCD4D|nr:CAP domain-containing protein [Massilia sp. IC2-477]MCC2954669.1 CAP domain-containing protein [Massilia sp. IC2-477]
MSYMPHWRSLIAALVAASTLAACGGGGGDSSSGMTAVPSGNTPPASTPATPSAVPGANAPVSVGNVAIDGRNWINYRRTQLGVPTVTENAMINNAALGHSEYLRTNNIMSHDQQAGRPGFTGTTLKDRLNAAGYTIPANGYAYGEVISGTTNGNGFYMAEELITAIYHRFVMFEPKFREIGTGAAFSSGGYHYFTADFATRNGFGPGIAAGSVVIWPFSGQTGVTPNFMSDSEDPDPVQGINEVGYPISVHANIDAPMTMQTFTVRPRGGANLQVQVVNSSATASQRTAIAIVPLAPLKAATTYDVSFAGTVNGAPVTRDWSFTTR